MKTGLLRSELTTAVADLRTEKTGLRGRLESARRDFNEAQALIQETLSPAVAEAHEKHSEQMEIRGQVRQGLSLLERITDLKGKRASVEGEFGSAGASASARAPISAGCLQALSTKIEGLHEAWRVPHEKPVYFDRQSQDLVLGSRRRGDQGKGLRALTHAAFNIGLQETCRSLALPCVGFVVLDSPLVTFREADADEAGLDAGLRVEVKKAFYSDLASRISTDQVIIVECEDPDVVLQTAIVSHLFTNRADYGRSGFYPAVAKPVPAENAAN